jgi:hypothetical protein
MASEEARKKRAFFPEDVIDLDFHTCLLSNFGIGKLASRRRQADGQI